MDNIEGKKVGYIDIIFKLFIGVFIVLDLVFLVQKLIALSDASFLLSFEEIVMKNKSTIIEIVLLLIFFIVLLICFVKYVKSKNIFVNLNIKSKIKFIMLLIVFIIGIGCYTSLAINDYNQQKIIEANESKEKAISDSRAELLIKTNEIEDKIMDFSLDKVGIIGIVSVEDNKTYIKKYTDMLDSYKKILQSKKDVLKESEVSKYDNLIITTENINKNLYELISFFDNEYKLIDMNNKYGSSIGSIASSKAATESMYKYGDIIGNYSDVLEQFVNSCTDFATEVKKNN